MKLATSLAAGLLAACCLCAAQNASAERNERPIAITGATVIDGNGGAPESNATVLIQGNRIAAVGAARLIAIPNGARVIEGKGRWVIPGLIDTNVHLSYPDGADDIPERQARDMLRLLKQLATFDEMQRNLAARFSIDGVPTVSLDLAAGRERLQKDLDTYLEFTREQREARQAGMLTHIRRNAQLHLRNGVTTVFDTDGYLRPLMQVRDEIASGKTLGPAHAGGWKHRRLGGWLQPDQWRSDVL